MPANSRWDLIRGLKGSSQNQRGSYEEQVTFYNRGISGTKTGDNNPLVQGIELAMIFSAFGETEVWVLRK